MTRISLADFPLPLYDTDLFEKSGPPFNALQLKQMLAAHNGVFIASPEYNASLTPLLKNTIDWISVVRERGEPPLAVFQNRVFAIGGCSPGRSGAMQSCIALRQVLAAGCRALVIGEQVNVPNAGDAFDEMDQLKDKRVADQLKAVVRKLIDAAALFAVVRKSWPNSSGGARPFSPPCGEKVPSARSEADEGLSSDLTSSPSPGSRFRARHPLPATAGRGEPPVAPSHQKALPGYPSE